MSDTTISPECGDGRASGRFVLRIEPALHEEIRRLAHAQGLSLNAWCARRLAADLLATPPAGGEETVRRAHEVAGEALVGLVVFGSWARGEAADDSDVDVLVVVDATVPLTRSLYRHWDEEAVTWVGHSVEPHFVHLPRGQRNHSGLWAEVAMDGIVIDERDYRLSRALGRVRRDILTGRLSRRSVHGQPFWVEAAVDAKS